MRKVKFPFHSIPVLASHIYLSLRARCVFIPSLCFLLGRACVCAHVFWCANVCEWILWSCCPGSGIFPAQWSLEDSLVGCLWLYISLLNGHRASYCKHHGRKEVFNAVRIYLPVAWKRQASCKLVNECEVSFSSHTEKGPPLEKDWVSCSQSWSPGSTIGLAALLEGETIFCEHLLDATDLNSSAPRVMCMHISCLSEQDCLFWSPAGGGFVSEEVHIHLVILRRAKGLQLFNFQLWRWVKLGVSFLSCENIYYTCPMWWENLLSGLKQTIM